MSGHSKWAQIKRQKGANDTKRGLAFTKLSMAITIAVREGGGVSDPNQNFRLRLAVEAARNSNMPKENISRAIERAAGKEGSSLEEAVYEGFAPAGVSVMVEAATDNKNRTTSEIQNIFNKGGGSMGQPGSVGYQFKQMGQLIVEKGTHAMDDIFMAAVDAGADDIEEAGEEIFIYTSPSTLSLVKDAVTKAGFNVKEMEIIRKPLTLIELGGEDAQKVMGVLEKLEELDDVQKVYSNFELKD